MAFPHKRKDIGLCLNKDKYQNQKWTSFRNV